MPRTLRDTVGLVGFLTCALGAAVVGYGFARESVASGSYERQLAIPAWTPPLALLGTGWVVLLALGALAAWSVWREKGWRTASVPLALFAVQLALQAAWPIFFFTLRNPGAAFFELLLVWLAVAVTAYGLEKARPRTGWLLLPGLVWLMCVAALNFHIWSESAALDLAEREAHKLHLERQQEVPDPTPDTPPQAMPTPP